MGERGYFNFEGGGPVNFNKLNYSRKEGDKKDGLWWFTKTSDGKGGLDA